MRLVVVVVVLLLHNTHTHIHTISAVRSACLNFEPPFKPKFSKHNPLIAYDSARIFKLRLHVLVYTHETKKWKENKAIHSV